MTAPLDAFVSGQYYVFYALPNVDGLNFPRYQSIAGSTLIDTGAGNIPSWVGATSGGFQLSTVLHSELVRGDSWGSSVVDTIYRGADVFLDWESISFRPGSVQTIWPYGLLGNMGTLGRLGSVTGGTLFMAAAPLTTTSGTPLIGQVIINALTARNAILREGMNQSMLFDSRLRRIPVSMRLLPFLSATYKLSDLAHVSTVTPQGNLPFSDASVNVEGVPTSITGTNLYTSNGYIAGPASNFVNMLTPGAGGLFDNSVPSAISSGSNVNLITQGLQGVGTTTRDSPYTSFPLYSWYSIL